jgi:hypothetical protein
MLTAKCPAHKDDWEVVDVKSGQRVEGTILLRVTAALEDPGRDIGGPVFPQRK